MSRDEAVAAVRALLDDEHAALSVLAPSYVVDAMVESLLRGDATPAQAAEAFVTAVAMAQSGLDEETRLETMRALAERHRSEN